MSAITLHHQVLLIMNFEDEATLLENNFIATHSLLAAIKENSPMYSDLFCWFK